MQPLRLLAALLATMLGLAPTPARPQDADPTEFTGRIVSHVALDAPRGVAPRQVEYLIEQAEGAPYSPQLVRRTVELLFRLGQFEDVRAEVAPRPDGTVDLHFIMTPSPRLVRVLLRGDRGLPSSVVRASLDRSPGDPFVLGDEARLAQQVETAYRARGYLDATATGRQRATRGRNRAVAVEVESGRRYRIGEIEFLGDEPGLSERRLRSFLGRTLAPGRFYREDALRDGLERFLVQMRKHGFVEARLPTLPGPRRRSRIPVEFRKDADTATLGLGIPLHAGHLVESVFRFEGERRPPWTQARLEEVVGLMGAARVSRTYAEDAARQLERFLWRRGFYHAEVAVAVTDEPAALPKNLPSWLLPLDDRVRVLRFDAKTGPAVELRERDITLRGNEFGSRRRVLAVLSEGSPEVLGHRLPVFNVLGFDVYQRHVTDGELAQAIDVLKDWYRARGYLAVAVTHRLRFVHGRCDGDPVEENGRRACLELTLAEGVRTSVESLEVVVEGPFAFEESTVALWERRFVGKPFNPAAVEELVQDVQGVMAERGYIDARVLAGHEVSTDGGLARLRVQVSPGLAARFGKVVVRESRHTQVGFIRRQVPIRPGEEFRRSVLQQAQGRLLRTGLFDGVVLRPVQSAGRVRDVELLVNERKRFSFVFGAGVTAPDDGPRVSGEARLRNLDGRGLSLWGRGRASVDWRSITLGVLLPEYRASIGVELPYLPGLPVRAAITGLLNEELDEPTYRISRSSLTIGLDWRPSNAVNVEARIEAQLRAPIRVDSVARLNALSDIPRESPRQNPQLLVMAQLSAVLDLRDDRFNPRKGLYLTGTLESTPGTAVPNSPSFGRVSARSVGLIPLGQGGAGLQFEAAGGLAFGYDGRLPPVEWRFRLGGTSTVRGFRLDAIGPTGDRSGVLETQGLLEAGGPERSVPVGGTAFYRYSVQVQLPMPGLPGWRFVVFHDAGNVVIAGKAPEGIDAGFQPVLHPSVGIGLRRITPIGPLRLDLAVRPERLSSLGKVFAGEQALAEVLQVHFAVGAL